MVSDIARRTCILAFIWRFGIPCIHMCRKRRLTLCFFLRSPLSSGVCCNHPGFHFLMATLGPLCEIVLIHIQLSPCAGSVSFYTQACGVHRFETQERYSCTTASVPSTDIRSPADASYYNTDEYRPPIDAPQQISHVEAGTRDWRPGRCLAVVGPLST